MQPDGRTERDRALLPQQLESWLGFLGQRPQECAACAALIAALRAGFDPARLGGADFTVLLTLK